jgi:hypothetical protein
VRVVTPARSAISLIEYLNMPTIIHLNVTSMSMAAYADTFLRLITSLVTI